MRPLLGNPEKARQYFEESLAILNIEGRNDSTAYTFLQLTAMERWQGNFAHAHELNAQSWAICQEMGNQPGKAWARCLLAELDHLQGHPELARPIYEENVETFLAFNDNWKAGWCLDKLGDVLFRLGDLPKAMLHPEAKPHFAGDGDRNQLSLNGVGGN